MALPPVLVPPLKRKKMLSKIGQRYVCRTFYRDFAVFLVNLVHSQENGNLHAWFAEIEGGSDIFIFVKLLRFQG